MSDIFLLIDYGGWLQILFVSALPSSKIIKFYIYFIIIYLINKINLNYIILYKIELLSTKLTYQTFLNYFLV